MRIGIISQSPLWTTGFGVTCNQLANMLVNLGHTVSCFSLGEGPNILEGYPFKIYQADWPVANTRLSAFITDEKPDLILINFDVNATVFFIRLCKLQRWSGKIFVHTVLDGFPVYEDLLKELRSVDCIIVPTIASKRYLISESLKNVYYAPHGVDRNVFTSLQGKEKIRLKLGLPTTWKDKYIIGVFAKNEERKQIPKILLALHHLVFTLKQKDILLYLHTQAQPSHTKGWDLESIANNLRLSKYVIFTAKDFQQERGVETQFVEIQNSKKLSYVERINMCDLIVNIPFSGGFELCNIEAQACGIPLITINDGGNIKEVVRESAVLINPMMKNFWGNGAWIYYVDEEQLACEILKLKSDPQLQEAIVEKGYINIKRFRWSRLRKVLQKCLIQQV